MAHLSTYGSDNVQKGNVKPLWGEKLKKKKKGNNALLILNRASPQKNEALELEAEAWTSHPIS